MQLTSAGATSHPRSLQVVASAFLILMVDGYDTLMVSFIAPLLAKDWSLAPTDIGKLFAVGYVGAIFGAIGMGMLADTVGRKRALIGALFLACVATYVCSTAHSLSMLMEWRFVAGIALGGALPALSSLTAEHSTPARQHGTVTLMYIGYPMGAVLGGAITAAFLNMGWPTIFFCTSIACLAATGVAATLPESLRVQNLSKADSATRRRPLFVEQFAEGRLLPALTLWLGLFAMLLLTYFLLSWTPTVIVDRGGSAKIAALGGVLLNLGGITGAVLSAGLINKYGPYRPVALLVAAGTLFVCLLGQATGSVALTMLLLFLTGVCILGGQLNFPAITADLFPAAVRGTGTGWTLGIGRLGSIVGPLAGGMLIASHLKFDLLFLIAAIPSVIAAIALFSAELLKGRGQPRPTGT